MDKTNLSQNTLLDEESGTIHILVDRVAISLFVEEFLDFFDDLDHARVKLMNHPSFVVCVHEEDGETKLQILPRPDDDDYS